MDETLRDKSNRINFTKRTIESLPIPKPGTRARYYDEKTHGLLLQITSTGSRTYWVRRKVKGVSQWERIGDCSIFSVEQARLKASEINGRLADRKCNDIRSRALREEPTLQVLFDEYIERHAKENRKTWKDMQANFRRYVSDFPFVGKRSLATMKVSEITAGMAHDLHKKLKQETQKRSLENQRLWLNKANKRLAWIDVHLEKVNVGLADTTNVDNHKKLRERKANLLNWRELAEERIETLVALKNKTERLGSYSANSTIQLLKAVVNCGIKFKSYSGENPFNGITLYKEQKRRRFLTDAEAANLFSVLDSLDGDIRYLVMILLLTGSRKMNVLSMRWDEINWDTLTWLIPETKNGEEQLVPLGPEERKILLARRDANSRLSKPSAFVFPGDGASGHLRFPQKSWGTIRRLSKLKDFTMHDLRRSLAAKMASSNVNLAIVKGVMGHKDIKTTISVYAHTTQNAQLEARLAAHQDWRRPAQSSPAETPRLRRK